MKKLVACVVLLILLASRADAGSSRLIRVGVFTGQSVRVGATEQWTAEHAGSVLATGQGCTLSVSLSGGRLAIDGRTVDGPVVVQPGSGTVQVNDTRYRGQLELSVQGGTLVVANVLPLEQYLYGVVPREMPPGWPAEALKAQAVAARTFALHALNSGKHSHHSVHVCTGVCCQVYRGADAEDARTTRAIDETAGLIIAYNGRPIQAFYHASAGGHTEHSENVWGSSVPYLRGVPDFDQDSPHYAWEVVLELGEVQRLLLADGIDVGNLHDLDVTGSRGPSGRAVNIRLAGSTGSTVIRSTTLRFALGLKSTLFHVELSGDGARELAVGRTGRSTVSVLGADDRVSSRVETTVAVGADGVRHRLSDVVLVGWQELPGGVVFTGQGWGHGVGMSQWGARSLAEQGHDFRYILTYYYQGTEVIPW